MTSPATIESSPYLLFQLGRSFYAIDAMAVREIIPLPELTPIHEAAGSFRGLLNLRGRVIPVMDLDHRFGCGLHPMRAENQIVVVEAAGQALGVLVDRVHDIRNIAGTAIQTNSSTNGTIFLGNSLIAGSVKLEEGLGMVLRLDALFQTPDEPNRAPAANGKAIFEMTRIAADASGANRNAEAEIFHRRALRLRESLESDDDGTSLAVAAVGLGGEYFGVDLAVVREFAELRDASPVPCCPPHILGQMNLRGDLLTVVDLRSALNLAVSVSDQARQVMVIQMDDLVAGVAVDEICDVLFLRPEEVQPVPASGRTSNEEYFKGTAAYRERMLSLLDLLKIFHRDGFVVNEEA